jgi:hypothetical protein
MVRRMLLPPTTVVLRCEQCGREVEQLDVNVQHLASELTRARRAHARDAHGWAPQATAPRPEPGHHERG